MRTLYLFILICISLYSSSQKSQWSGYFSYNEITDVFSKDNRIVCSTRNSLFIKDLSQNTIKQITSIEGFKPETITTIYLTQNNTIFVGCDNGLVIIIKPDGTIINRPEIIQEVVVPATNKRINDFYEYNGRIYLSTEYGISVIELSNLNYKETYYIGNSGEYLNVFQTTVFNNEIYAVTQTQGIKKASITNPFLYDFSQWSSFNNGAWFGIANFNNQIVAGNSDGNFYKFNGNIPTIFGTYGSTPLKFRVQNNYLLFCANYQSILFDQNLTNVSTIYTIQTITDSFTSATIGNGKHLLATTKNGLFETNFNSSIGTYISPNGPLSDTTFRVEKATNDLWLTHGGFDRTYDPDLKLSGISLYNKDLRWHEIKKEDLFNALSLSMIIENPRNKSEIFVASEHSGLLKINNKNPLVLYNHTNTGSNGLNTVVLPPPDQNYISVRVNGLTYDKDNNLWMNNAFTAGSIKVLKTDNTWSSYNISNYLDAPLNERYGNMVIDNNGTKWVASFLNGVIGFNEKYNNKTIVVNTERGLADNDVRCVAVDKKGQLWIGSFRGLRIIRSVDRFISDTNLTATNIVIQDGDLAQELFYQQFIQDIYVDGANRKWVAIQGSGVFLVSEDGQSTIFKFTKENSPLPSDNVMDIDIDEVTGEVYFATDKGLVSFRGTATEGASNLENAFIYPNPVRPNYIGTVKVSGLMDQVNVKITDVEGNLVYETTSEGGTIEWDTTAFGKYKVASGVYVVFITDKEGNEKVIKKLAIVR